jgi:hypothetical protein
MAQPTPYVPSTSFVSYQATQPWFPGQNIDIELQALKTTTDQICANLALIQNDDTTLKNGCVDTAQLSSTVQSLLGLVGSITTFLPIAAGTTAKSQINLATSVAPSSPNNGDIWFDGSNLKIRIGGATKTVTVS